MMPDQYADRVCERTKIDPNSKAYYEIASAIHDALADERKRVVNLITPMISDCKQVAGAYRREGNGRDAEIYDAKTDVLQLALGLVVNA